MDDKGMKNYDDWSNFHIKICQDCALHYVKVRNRNEYTYIYIYQLT